MIELEAAHAYTSDPVASCRSPAPPAAPSAPGQVLDLFRPATRAWFRSTFAAPTQAQVDGWRAIAAGRHTLIHAPTGSGKTLAAFLWCLDRLTGTARPLGPDWRPKPAVRVLYISPLKALTYDVERNLRAPLAGIALAAARLHEPLVPVSVGSRTGDTSSEERRQLARRPPDILITTPESLYLLLTSQAREILAQRSSTSSWTRSTRSRARSAARTSRSAWSAWNTSSPKGAHRSGSASRRPSGRSRPSRASWAGRGGSGGHGGRCRRPEAA